LCSKDEYVGPRNEVEQQLCQIWGSVLGLDRVGIKDNFFRLGGNSISAVRLCAQMEKEFGVFELQSQFYRCSTIESVGVYISDHQSSNQNETIIVF
ncbi:phosphopantetheine-binding protein, partial [Shewanella baltica]